MGKWESIAYQYAVDNTIWSESDGQGTGGKCVGKK